MNRLERLLNLVAALLAAERPLRREEIEERVPGYEGEPKAVRRAFERDKESLRRMGVPLIVSQIDPSSPEPVEGYTIRREDYELPDPGLAPEELAALHLAATTIRLEGGTATEAMWKLGGAPTAPSAATGGAGAGELAALPGSEHLTVLFGAVSDRRTVTFPYRGGTRTVDPWRLSFRNGFWYLTGFDRDRADERQFRLDRLQGAPVAGPPEAFSRPPSRAQGPVPPWEMGDDEPEPAVVRVDASQADWVVSRVQPGDVLDRRPDGSVTVALRVRNRDAFRSLVLGLLDHAEVVEPPALRADVVTWLERMAAS